MKIGILGGTFNPIHLGHIELAKSILKKLKLDKMIFVPTFVPPHKPGKGIVSSKERYKMVELAIDGMQNMEASDIEIRRKGTSYSVDTIKEFKVIYGDAADLYFIAGSDYAGELQSWKDIGDLKRLCSFVIATRPGYRDIQQLPDTHIIDIDTPNISSSDIRRRIGSNISFKELVPQQVYNYIVTRRLYL